MSLNALPPEILAAVFANFRPDLPVDPSTEEILKLWEDVKTLHNACQVSRRLAAVATEHLYHTIVFYMVKDEPRPNYGSVVLLLRTLCENLALRTRVERLLFGFYVVDESPPWHMDFEQRLWPSAIANSWDNYRSGFKLTDLTAVEVFRLAGLGIVRSGGAVTRSQARIIDSSGCQTFASRHVERLQERIFAAILCLASGLRAVGFRVSGRILSARSQLELASSIIRQTLQNEGIETRILQKLESVALHCHWNRRDMYPLNPKTWATRCDVCPALMMAPRLVEVYGKALTGGWRSLPINIRHISLLTPFVELDSLDMLCSFEKLEHLSIKFPAPTRRTREVRDWNETLLKRAGSLKSLRYLDDTRLKGIGAFGPHERLHCLPRLNSLAKLSVEAHALFGTSANIGRLHLSELLPQSLERLHVLEIWSIGDPAGRLGNNPTDYQQELTSELLSFAVTCEMYPQKLQKFIWERVEEPGRITHTGHLQPDSDAVPFGADVSTGGRSRENLNSLRERNPEDRATCSEGFSVEDRELPDGGYGPLSVMSNERELQQAFARSGVDFSVKLAKNSFIHTY